jgi:hypothetical protein
MCIHFTARLFIRRRALKNTPRSKEKICALDFKINGSDFKIRAINFSRPRKPEL